MKLIVIINNNCKILKLFLVPFVYSVCFPIYAIDQTLKSGVVDLTPEIIR